LPLHGWEILIVLLIILIVFGPGKLPQVFGALGKGMREFKKAKDEDIASSNESEKLEDKKKD